MNKVTLENIRQDYIQGADLSPGNPEKAAVIYRAQAVVDATRKIAKTCGCGQCVTCASVAELDKAEKGT